MSADVDSLAAWLRACLDDDEQVAREATPGPWVATENMCIQGAGRRVIASVAARELWPTMADAGHIARWDPARVLAEVDAKRRTLELHGPSQGSERRCTWCGDSWPCLDLMNAALPFAGRPGYRPEWRP